MSGSSWTDVVQTVAIVAALLFTAWELRSRTLELRYRNYLDAISGSVDLAKLLVENTNLHAIFEYSNIDWTERSYAELTPDKKAMVHYCDLYVAHCETVWLAAEEGWVPNDEWPHWQADLHRLNRSPAFRWTLGWIQEDYDQTFLSDITVLKSGGPGAQAV